MNYNERNPTFSFRLNHVLNQRLTKMAKLEKQTTNELARTILSNYLNGKLVEKKSDDKQERLLELKIKKLEQEIKYMEIKNAFAQNFHAPLSRSATVHIKPEIVVETPNSVETIRSPYDESNKRLQCTDCGCLFTWNGRDNFIDQMGEFHRHLLSKHNRELNPIEKDVVLKLEYEGDSR
jgi:hypothetical protein